MLKRRLDVAGKNQTGDFRIIFDNRIFYEWFKVGNIVYEKGKTFLITVSDNHPDVQNN